MQAFALPIILFAFAGAVFALGSTIDKLEERIMKRLDEIEKKIKPH